MGKVADEFKDFYSQAQEFAKKVKSMRDSKNMTQEELSDKVGISRPSLANIERGVHIPSLEVAKKLADALDISVDFLLSKRSTPSTNDLSQNNEFAHFILRASQKLSNDDKERIKQIINAWQEKGKDENT